MYRKTKTIDSLLFFFFRPSPHIAFFFLFYRLSISVFPTFSFPSFSSSSDPNSSVFSSFRSSCFSSYFLFNPSYSPFTHQTSFPSFYSSFLIPPCFLQFFSYSSSRFPAFFSIVTFSCFYSPSPILFFSLLPHPVFLPSFLLPPISLFSCLSSFLFSSFLLQTFFFIFFLLLFSPSTFPSFLLPSNLLL